jgi:hypothetical protein
VVLIKEKPPEDGLIGGMVGGLLWFVRLLEKIVFSFTQFSGPVKHQNPLNAVVSVPVVLFSLLINPFEQAFFDAN